MFYMTTYFFYYWWILDYTWDNLFWFYSFITIPVVVLNNVVQNTCNILFILIEWTASNLLLTVTLCDYISGLHCSWLFLLHAEIYLSDRFFFLNFGDWFHQWRFRLDIRKNFLMGVVVNIVTGCPEKWEESTSLEVFKQHVDMALRDRV